MGVFNSIHSYVVNCPMCHGKMFPSNDTVPKGAVWQSKDFSGEMLSFHVGHPVEFERAGLRFISVAASEDTVWSGCTICWSCNKTIYCDIIIRRGIISEFKNFRLYE
jgi:hypothetical protein